MGSEDARNRAFLDCADAVIRKSDIVLAILSADRWDSQTGKSARDAVALGLPLLVIDPALPGQPLLHRKEGIVPADDAGIADMVRSLLDRRLPNDIARAKAALAAGDFLTALDLLRHAPDDPDLRRRAERDYLLVLALAAGGARRRLPGWSAFASGWRMCRWTRCRPTWRATSPRWKRAVSRTLHWKRPPMRAVMR